MRLTIERAAFLKALAHVQSVVERRNTIPILSNVLIESVDGKAAFVATDLELQLTAWADEAGAKDTAFTVSARKLLDICRSLPETDIGLELAGEQLKLAAGKSRFNLQTLPARDFPRLQIPEGEGVSFSLPQRVLRHLLARVQYAMAVQDIRFYLNGMLLQLKDGQVTVAATDGHRLAVDSAKLDSPLAKDLEVILPRKAVVELIKLLGDGDEAVEVQVSPNQVVVRGSHFELRSKVVDGKFPDYQRVVPVGHDKDFSIGRQTFNQSLVKLFKDGLASEAEVLSAASSPDDLKLAMRGIEQEIKPA